MVRKRRPGKDIFALLPFDNNASVEERLDWKSLTGRKVPGSTVEGPATAGKKDATCEVTLNPMACLSLWKTP